MKSSKVMVYIPIVLFTILLLLIQKVSSTDCNGWSCRGKRSDSIMDGHLASYLADVIAKVIEDKW